MADRRYFFKMDVGYLDNPKVAPLVESNPRAVLLHMWAIAYSRQHGTDGVVPARRGLRDVWIEPCSEQCPMHCQMQCKPECDVAALVHAGLVDVVEGNLVVHDYLEHQESSESIKTRSDKGRQAALARWSDANRNASGNASGIASSNASGNAEERRGEEIYTSAPSGADQDFAAWWVVYPRKVGKGQAVKAYRAARKKTDQATLIAAAASFAAASKGTDPKFTPHPATWLNGERWLDTPPDGEPSSKPASDGFIYDVSY